MFGDLLHVIISLSPGASGTPGHFQRGHLLHHEPWDRGCPSTLRCGPAHRRGRRPTAGYEQQFQSDPSSVSRVPTLLSPSPVLPHTGLGLVTAAGASLRTGDDHHQPHHNRGLTVGGCDNLSRGGTLPSHLTFLLFVDLVTERIVPFASPKIARHQLHSGKLYILRT